MKLSTPVLPERSAVTIDQSDTVTILGSCFADSMGARLSKTGFNVCINPFGTLYNPASISNAAARLDSDVPFTEDDCVQMGAGAGLICSFEHHTSFARPTSGEFLCNANRRLEESRRHWKSSDKVIITLGTAQVWRLPDGRVVSNCLKRPGHEFSHDMLSADETGSLLHDLVLSHPDKSFIFTVSPIRHMGEGAHTNTLSKATLQLGIQQCLCERAVYFPAYEILLDELRDYRFYADDLVHPSNLAEEIIWERFVPAVIPPELHDSVRKAEKEARHLAHRSLQR